MPNRESLEIVVVTILAIIFSMFSISLQLLERVYFYLHFYGSLLVAQFSSNFALLYLVGLLWLTFRRWRRAVRKHRELEEITSSISPDTLIAINNKSEIVMCNSSVTRMFGYSADEVVRQKVDFLYAAGVTPSIGSQAKAMEDRGNPFQVSFATGKKKDGSMFPIEVLRGDLPHSGGAVMLLRDITERKKAEEALKSAYAELDQIFNVAADGMFVVDSDLNVLRANRTLVSMLGLSEKEMIGRKCHELFRCPRCLTSRCFLTELHNDRDYLKLESEIERNDGAKIPCLVTVAPFVDPEGRLIGVIEGMRDITDLKDIEEKLRTLSTIDELTGMYNRRGFLTFAEQQMKLAQRTGRGMLLLFIDLDRMKWINDTLGHKEGDRALIDTAEALRKSLRSCDVVGRIGGDEFAVITVEASESSDRIIRKRICDNIAMQRSHGGREYELTVSIGITYYNGLVPSTVEELLEKADASMYEEKRAKKGETERDARKGD